MTTRAIKKLTKKDDLKSLAALNNKNEKNESDDESESNQTGSFYVEPKNKFDLLDELENESDPNDDENKTDDESKETVKLKSKTKTKSKKRKSKSKTASDDSTMEKDSFNFVSTTVKEDLDDFEATASFFTDQKTKCVNENLKSLFRIESKYLNSDNEMIRMFGAKIVQAERAAVSGRGNRSNNRGVKSGIFKQNSLVNSKSTWPQFIKNGLSMRLVKEDENFIEFTLEHNTDYQKLQFAFLDSVESLDHNNIINVLHIYPYHIDSLIQLSDVSRTHDDSAMAGDLIERALFAIQNSFHPSFNFTKASSNNKLARFDYNRTENRCFFITLFKHILYLGGKACYRTSLEFCKLLLSLDIDGDPLASILLLDFYAIKSMQYDFLIEFYTTFNPTKHLNLMPNMSMSTALAYFYKYKQTSDATYLESANKLLEETLINFPSILMELLDKCNVQPDKEVEKHWVFSKVSHLNSPEGLKYLVGFYVTRMHYEWRIPENLEWLEKTVKSIISPEKSGSLKNAINSNKKKFNSLFSRVPPNLYRHLILSDLKEVSYRLPPEYSSTATYTFDPISPKNSIISYTRPVRQPSSNQATTTTRAEALLTFFQSLMPSFNVQDNIHNNRNDFEEQGAAAEGGGDGQANGRFDMNQMINRLRDFLTSIEQHFPAAPPTLNPNNNHQDDRDNNDNNNLDEFD